MSQSTDLPVFLANYGPSFARTAYLLTGDADRGRELAVDALVAVGRRWSAVRWSQPVQAVLRELYRRFLAGDAPTSGAYALGALPPAARAVVVARFHDGLPPQQAAAITGLGMSTLAEESHQAPAYLRATRPDLFTTPPPTPFEPPRPEQTPSTNAPPIPPKDERSSAERAPSEDERPRDGHGLVDDRPTPQNPAAGHEAQPAFPGDKPAAEGRTAAQRALPENHAAGEQSRSAPWAAPWDTPGSSLGTASSVPEATSAAPGAKAWAAPAVEPGDPGAAAWAAPGTGAGDPTTAAAGPAGSAPWTAPARAWDVVPDDDDPALRAALSRIAAAEMPHIHLSEPVLRRIGRRRRIRAATWTTVSVGVLGAFTALIVITVAAVARNIEQVATDPTGGYPDYTQSPADIPEALPATLNDPIHYASLGYCGRATNDPADPEPCGQWQLTTVSGEVWRLPGAGAGYDETSGADLPLAVSQDGRRLAYRNNQGSFVVHDLPTGAVKRIDVDDQSLGARLMSSPNGRYFAIYFDGALSSALLDFDTGVTRYTTGAELEILAVRDDGAQVVSETENVDDVPGHASVTTIELRGARLYAGGYRIDPDLVSYGAALSPDGRTLALVAQGQEVVTMDVATGRVFGPRTALQEEYDVISVERWISADEVLVRQWDDDDYTYLTKVDVGAGTVTPFDGGESEWLDYDTPLGVLEP